jgi:acetylornithine deacetylase
MTIAERVGAAVDANWEREIAFLRGLVTRRSTLGDEALVQRFVAAELGDLGLEVDTWDVDPASLARLPGHGPVEWSFAGRPNVGARWAGAGGGGRSLVFQGHIDVVPATPEHHWTRDPWGAEVAEGRMWGRGAADMKAGVAAMVYAVRALREAGVRLRGDVSLVTVIEEECTGNGALSALARGYTGDAAIIPEPFGDQALQAQVGVLWARITVRGHGGHAERASEVQNAIAKAARVIDAVGALEAAANRDELRHPQFEDVAHPLNYNVGVVRGGDWPSTVPEECVLEVRLGTYPGEHLPDVQARFRTALTESLRDDPWLAEHPPEVTFYAFQADGFVIARDAPIMRTLAGAHHELTGGELGFLSFTGTTDARFFNLYYNVPATCYGPLGGNLHAPDEWVDLESVRQVTKVLAATALEWCGVASPPLGSKLPGLAPSEPAPSGGSGLR